MALEWWTYKDGGAQLGISGEAFRKRAIRAYWTRRSGKVGKTEVWANLEQIKAARPHRRQQIKPQGQPSDVRWTPEHPIDARTFETLSAHVETLTGMLAVARQDIERESKRADEGWNRATGLVGEISRLQAEFAAREDDHAATIAAMSRRCADEVSEARGDAAVQREVAEIALAKAHRLEAEVNSAEQARKEQVRAEHERWQALPWVLRMKIPEPPRIDMFGNVSVRTAKGARRVA